MAGALAAPWYPPSISHHQQEFFTLFLAKEQLSLAEVQGQVGASSSSTKWCVLVALDGRELGTKARTLPLLGKVSPKTSWWLALENLIVAE